MTALQANASWVDGMPGSAEPWPLAALVHLQAGIVILDEAYRVVFVNEWFLRHSGKRSEELMGHRLTGVFPHLIGSYFCSRLALSVKTGFPAMMSHSLHSPPLPLYMPHSVGHPPALLSQTVHIIPMGKRAARQSGRSLTLVQVTDVTPTVRREHLLRTRADEMQLMARVDALTGVGNRRKFSESLECEARAAMRDSEPLGMLMIDIDHFKAYNDHYGHPTGDQCLREVAALLKRVVRRPRDHLSRYGGEEFVVLLPGTPLHGVVGVGREILEHMRRLALPHAASPGGRIVTLSLGAAALEPSCQEDGATLLRRADEALYAAKGAGRNRLVSQPGGVTECVV
jgi:diguanylate cyclase (GGDEF)-like protein